MDYSTDDVPAELKIVEHPPGQFAWVIVDAKEAALSARLKSQDGYASYEAAMAAGRLALGLPP